MFKSILSMHPQFTRSYIVPTRKVNVVNVYEQTPRLIPKNSSPLLVQKHKLYTQYDPQGTKRQLLYKKNPLTPKAGDIMKITKTDKSTFVGMLIALNRNGVGSTILLRTKIGGIGVENRFHVFNPDIEKIEVVKVPAMRWPKEKYYFVRGSKNHDAGDLDGMLRRQRRQ